MNIIFIQSLEFLAVFFIGFMVARYWYKRCQNQSKKGGVIGIFSGVVHDPEKVKLYSQAAVPLAAKAGLEMIGHSETPVVIEGEWPYPGFVVVEKFSSMEAWQQYISKIRK